MSRIMEALNKLNESSLREDSDYIEMSRDAFRDYQSIAWSIGEFFYPDDEVACYVNDNNCSTAEAVELLKADIDRRIKEWEAKYGIPFKAYSTIYTTGRPSPVRLGFDMNSVREYLTLPKNWKANPEDYEDLV